VRVSQATGLNIVMGTGFYIAPSHPDHMGRLTEEEICEEIVSEVTVEWETPRYEQASLAKWAVPGPCPIMSVKPYVAQRMPKKRTGAL